MEQRHREEQGGSSTVEILKEEFAKLGAPEFQSPKDFDSLVNLTATLKQIISDKNIVFL